MEAQFSQEMTTLVNSAKFTIADARVLQAILKEASAISGLASRQLEEVEFIVDRKSDFAIRAKISEVNTEISRLGQQTFTSTERVETFEGALARFRQIRDGYAGLAGDARATVTQAKSALALAQAYVGEVAGEWLGSGARGTPYPDFRFPNPKVVFEFPDRLSADAVAQAVLGDPRIGQVRVGFATAVSEAVQVEVDGILETRIRFSEGARHTTAIFSADPAGVVSLVGETITGVKAGKATVTASTQGLLTHPIIDFLYTPEQFDALGRGPIGRSRTVTVREFVGIEVAPSDCSSCIFVFRQFFCHKQAHQAGPFEVDLFVPANRKDWIHGDENENRLKMDLRFETTPDRFTGVNTFTLEANERNMTRTSSNPEVAHIVAKARDGNRNVLIGGEPGTAVISLGIVDGAGVVVHEDPLRVSYNEVQVSVNNFSREGLGLSDGKARGQEAPVHAGQLAELKVEIDGKTDMSAYEVHWTPHWDPGPTQPELENLITPFSGSTSINRLRVPIDHEPNSPPFSYDLRMEIYPRGDLSKPVYSIFMPGIHTMPARLAEVRLLVGAVSGEEPITTAELHLFTSRINMVPEFGPVQEVAEVQILPKAFFIDDLNNRITTEIFQVDGRPHDIGQFHNHTRVLLDETVLSHARRDDFRFISPEVPQDSLKSGSSPVYTISFARPLKTKEDVSAPLFGEGPIVSRNAIKVYHDVLRLVGQRERTVAAGKAEPLRVEVETDTGGDLTDYRVVWSLNPAVGGLGLTTTDFVQGQDGSWHSENDWSVPADREGQSVFVEVVVRLKGAAKDLGKDMIKVTIGGLPPPTGAISGMVSDAQTLEGIGGATVEAVGTAGEGTFSTTAGANGSFTLTDLPEGTYDVTASFSGYKGLTQQRPVTAGATTTLDFALQPVDPLPGDVNDDGIVDSRDLRAIAAALNTQQGDASFDVSLDLQIDGVIDIVDVARAAMNFVKTSVQPTLSATLFELVDFQGRSETFTEDNDCLIFSTIGACLRSQTPPQTALCGFPLSRE